MNNKQKSIVFYLDRNEDYGNMNISPPTDLDVNHKDLSKDNFKLAKNENELIRDNQFESNVNRTMKNGLPYSSEIKDSKTIQQRSLTQVNSRDCDKQRRKIGYWIGFEHQQTICVVGYIPYQNTDLIGKVRSKRILTNRENEDRREKKNEFRTLTDVSSDEFHINIAQVQDTLVGGMCVVGVWSPSIKNLRTDVLKLYSKQKYFISFPTKNWVDHDSTIFPTRIENAWIESIKEFTTNQSEEFKSVPMFHSSILPINLAQYHSVYYPRYSFNNTTKRVRMKHCCKTLDPEEGHMVVHIVPKTKSPSKKHSKDDNLDSDSSTKSAESIPSRKSNAYVNSIQQSMPSTRRTVSFDGTFGPIQKPQEESTNILPEYDCTLLYNTSSIKQLIITDNDDDECLIGDEGSFILVCMAMSIDMVHQKLHEDVQRSLRCRSLFNTPVYRKVGTLCRFDSTWYMAPPIHMMSTFTPQGPQFYEFPSATLNERYVLQAQKAAVPSPPPKALQREKSIYPTKPRVPWYATTGCSIAFFSILLALIALFMLFPSRA